MTEQPSAGREPSSGNPGLALGAILVIVGLILFAGQVVDVGIGDLGWPFWIIGAGVAILLVGLLLVTEQGIVVGGVVVTVVGLVLLYQEATNHWESWAYAWALVGPAAAGFGMMLWGVRDGDRGAMRSGFWGLMGGLGFFIVGFLFFEGIIGISGRRLPLPDWTLPAAVIGIGVVLLVRSLLDRGERDETPAT
jgi:hypothetical protein